MSTVNGQEFQHASLRTNVLTPDGAPFAIDTLKKIMLKAQADKEAVYNSQGIPRGFVIKPLKYDSSWTLLRSEWLLLKSNLLQQYPGLGILQVQMDLDLTYGNSLAALQTIKAGGIMFNSDGLESEDNQDPWYIEIPLFVLWSTDENGIAPIVSRV